MSISKRPQFFGTAFRAENMTIQPLSLNPGGKGKSAWVNMKDNNNLFEGPDFRVNFPAKPGMNETQVKSSTKLKVTLQIDTDNAEQAQFAQKTQEADRALLEHFFNKKNQIWPDKAKFLNDVSALMGMYNPIVKDGKMNESGVAYKPSFSLQLYNCADLIERLVTEVQKKPDGSSEVQVKDVIWKTVLCRSGEKPNEKAPKFYLWLGKDEEGNDIVTQKVEVRGKDGKPLLNSDGSKVKRWVGPQDIKAGCMVRPVFRIQKAYLVTAFGLHLVAEAMVIKPPPPKEVADFSNVKVVEEHEFTERASLILDSPHEIPEDALPEDNHDEEEGIPAPTLEETNTNTVTTTTNSHHEESRSEELRSEELRSPSTSLSGKKRKNIDESSRKKKVSNLLNGDDE